MRIRDVLAESLNRTPVSVQYDFEPTNTDEYESHVITITGDVITIRDAYGTGDSPTEYEFDVKNAVYAETGQPFDIKLIPDDAWEWIDNTAIEKAQRA